jgi:hypothetical protein
LCDTLTDDVTPDQLQDVLELVLENRMAQVWTALPGIVQSYDATTQTASVRPAVQDPKEDGDGLRVDTSLPVITDCPVAWPRGAGQYWHPGLAAGDEVVIVFTTLDPAVWYRTGSLSKAADVRRHHPSHAFVLPGVGSRGRPLPATPGAKIQRMEVGGTADAPPTATQVRAQLIAIKAAMDTIATAAGAVNSYVVPALSALQSTVLKVSS